jgi:hypothetical protein
MLSFFSKPTRNGGFCDGVSRRDFLTVGGSLVGGLTLADILRAEAAGHARTSSHRAVINVFLPGGPPHMDMWDLKPDAPREFRGEFRPIQTNVTGVRICELFPRMARIMDKFILVRSLADSDGRHDCYQCMTGRKRTDQGFPFWPMLGSWVSRLQGQAHPAVPANVSLMYRTGEGNWGNPYHAGFIGRSHDPVPLTNRGPGDPASRNMVLNPNITLDRLHDRVGLRRAFDAMRSELDASGAASGVDICAQQALGVLTSSALVNALDVSKEDARVRARYGQDDPAFERDGAPRMVRSFLLARRLVEAGARVVTLNFSRWDWHGGDGMNFPEGRRNFPLLDSALSALVEDLHARGLNETVSVVVWGEFGRTPRLNNRNSRDHWPQANCAVLAGGGMRTGQVIGSTNRLGERPNTRPVKFQEIFATLYRNLGIDLSQARVVDPTGRPQFLVDSTIEPMREVI